MRCALHGTARLSGLQKEVGGDSIHGDRSSVSFKCYVIPNRYTMDCLRSPLGVKPFSQGGCSCKKASWSLSKRWPIMRQQQVATRVLLCDQRAAGHGISSWMKNTHFERVDALVSVGDGRRTRICSSNSNDPEPERSDDDDSNGDAEESGKRKENAKYESKNTDEENIMQMLNDEMSKRMSTLAEELGKTKDALKMEENRQRALAPYRVSSPRYGIIGNSRYAVELRKKIISASQDERRQPILIFGEPGLHKFNTASLIHFGSKDGRYPLASIDCSRLDADASELFGRGARKGLLQWLPAQGTIILTNVHKALPEVLPLIQNAVAIASMAASIDSDDDMEYDFESTEEDEMYRSYRAFPRIIMTAETRVSGLEKHAKSIQIPPLRVRPRDIKDLVYFHLRKISKQRGLGLVTLTPEALRALEAGKYPNNISELEAAVERAVAQSLQSQIGSSEDDSETKSLEIGEEVFWFASGKKTDQFRANLLKPLPLLRSFLRSEFWPKSINFKFTVYIYAAIVLYLFIGPQDRDHNFALNAFWCYWWPLSFVAYPFLGRIWCTICPFMIYGELVQKLRLNSGAKLMKWPREALDKWGYSFLFSLFAAILIWEEVWDLPQTAYLSSCLLLLITAGAMIGSFFYERRIWCRYLCPIGGMNGLFSKMAMTELRATQGVCSAECTTYTCYKGGPEIPPEGMESPGCPLYSHPAQLADNRNCVLCMECLKACPHRSVEFRMRLPGADLWNSSHQPIPEELALAFILLGSVELHKLPLVLEDLGLGAYEQLILSDKGYHILASVLILAFPGITAWSVDAVWRLIAKLLSVGSLKPSFAFQTPNMADEETQKAVDVLSRATNSYAGLSSNLPVVAPAKPFSEIGYGYLPLVWSSILAYYLDLLLLEAGHILEVAGSSVGIDPSWIPAWEANPAVVTFLQGSTILLGISSSLVLSRKIVGQPWRLFLPQCICIIGFGAELWHVILHK